MLESCTAMFGWPTSAVSSTVLGLISSPSQPMNSRARSLRGGIRPELYTGVSTPSVGLPLPLKPAYVASPESRVGSSAGATAQ